MAHLVARSPTPKAASSFPKRNGQHFRLFGRGQEGKPESHGAYVLKREIAATDEEIDELVYDLYGITDEERKIIEGK